MRSIYKGLFVMLFIFSAMVLVLPIKSFAAETIHTDQPVTVAFRYKNGDHVIPNANFSLYRVADTNDSAYMTVTSEFAPYADIVSGLASLNTLSQTQWLTLASSLDGYVRRDGLVPDAKGTTDQNGELVLSELEAGLYLVLGNRILVCDGYIYSSVPFLMFLPGKNTATGEWNYDVIVSPKFEKESAPSDDNVISRKVLKVWDDAGYEALRPNEVIVQLLKDGKVYDTQTLSKDNNWRYAWNNLNANYKWDVIEKKAEGYSASITRTGITFTITNRFMAPVLENSLSVQKRISGDRPAANSSFTFVLNAENSLCPMPAGSSGTIKKVTINGSGSQCFGEICFTKAGKYVYKVSEKNSGIAGYTFDNTVYTIVFEIMENEGELSSAKTITDSSGRIVSVIEFTNNYKTPGEKLPQTGVIWWPVPVLFCGGFIFILIGLCSRRRDS